jgi:hypothetical protein
MASSTTGNYYFTADFGQGTVADGGTASMFTAPADCSYAEVSITGNSTNQSSDANYSAYQVYLDGTGENDLYIPLINDFRTGANYASNNGGVAMGTVFVAPGSALHFRPQYAAGNSGTLGYVYTAKIAYDVGRSVATSRRRTRAVNGQGTGTSLSIYTAPANCQYAEVTVTHNDTSQTNDSNYGGALLRLGTNNASHLVRPGQNTFRTGDVDRANGGTRFSAVVVPAGVQLFKVSGNIAGNAGTAGHTFSAVEYY